MCDFSSDFHLQPYTVLEGSQGSQRQVHSKFGIHNSESRGHPEDPLGQPYYNACLRGRGSGARLACGGCRPMQGPEQSGSCRLGMGGRSWGPLQDAWAGRSSWVEALETAHDRLSVKACWARWTALLQGMRWCRSRLATTCCSVADASRV